MKNYLILVLVCQLICMTATSLAQDSTNATITIKKSALGRQYIYQDKKLKMNEFKNLLKQEPATAPELKTAQKYYGPAMVLSAVGGFCIGWPIGTALGGGEDPNWTLAAAGGGIVVVALILGGKANQHFDNAAEIYNDQMKNRQSKIDCQFYCTLNRVGLSISF